MLSISTGAIVMTPGSEDSVQLKNYLFKVDNSFQDLISRQRNEMFRISNFQGTLINSNSEWNALPIIRRIVQN